MKHKRPHIAVAPLSFELQGATNEIQLLPAGSFRARDGRPHDATAWQLDATVAAALVAHVNARTTPLVIDYDHQTLHAPTSGNPAPAAGFFSRVEWREGLGLFALDIEWNQRAKDLINAGEYRYVSAVPLYTPGNGHIVDLLCASITNAPAIDGLDAIQAALTAYHNHQEESDVKREELIALLGLAITATDAEISAAMAQMKSTAVEVDGLKAKVAELEAAAPDPAKFVPAAMVEEMKTELAALRAQVVGREVNEVVAAALSDGRLLPAQESWARDLGSKDLKQLQDYVAATPKIAALSATQTGGQQPASGQASLGDEEERVIAQMGISRDDYIKNKG